MTSVFLCIGLAVFAPGQQRALAAFWVSSQAYGSAKSDDLVGKISPAAPGQNLLKILFDLVRIGIGRKPQAACDPFHMGVYDNGIFAESIA